MTSQNLTSLQHQFSGWEQAQEYYVEANLTGANLAQANLRRAVLADVVGADFTGAILE